MIIFGVLILLLLVIPNGFEINAEMDWKPVWNIFFLLYAALICISVTIVPSLYYAIVLLKKFENKDLKKKWKYFIIGISSYFFVWAITSISNTLNIASFRTITALLTVLTIPSIYLIYYGVGKQL